MSYELGKYGRKKFKKMMKLAHGFTIKRISCNKSIHSLFLTTNGKVFASGGNYCGEVRRFLD